MPSMAPRTDGKRTVVMNSDSAASKTDEFYNYEQYIDEIFSERHIASVHKHFSWSFSIKQKVEFKTCLMFHKVLLSNKLRYSNSLIISQDH